ncbi:MAG: HDOD domain-containing protein [Gammaproteobacteria bacterium]|nr:HDOD domain-containing protein [Gammaproteobacteria bacterium]MBU1776332.1 HDOD domain-containing protein [Gammaproteobacteria bacterium]MBU1967814.1 HDOD domain-containing protein [Gammaproteobacteria bacterium]
MQRPELKGLEHWVAYLTQADLPVLKQTGRDLATLHEDQNKLSARSVASVIAVDPMMTVKLLRYLQQNKRRSQTSEVALVEQALIMMGVEAFYNKIPAAPTVQDVLKGHMEALVQLLHVLHRAHRASAYAYDWAVRLSDLHYEEVRIAALLHELAEMLMWCYAPQEMMGIHVIQQQDKTLRSRAVQEQVLGFALRDLQKILIKNWELPELLLALMDDQNAQKPRVRNVLLAVNLARHSANGWDDAALPDDYKDIAELLRMTPEQVMLMLGVEAGTVCDLSKPHD